MIDRFAGEAGRRILLGVLKEQKLIAGNADMADRVISLGELVNVESGVGIIKQGDDDNDVYLIVAGSFDIVVNNRVIARRFANDHVGEMVAIQPTQRRSASVIARETAVVVKIPEPQFEELCAQFPQIMHHIAKELARRLIQRNVLVTAVSEKIRVFIISSAEALEVARTIQNAFDHDPFNVTVWTDGVGTPPRESRQANPRLKDPGSRTDF